MHKRRFKQAIRLGQSNFMTIEKRHVITPQWVEELKEEEKLVRERSFLQRKDEKLQEHLINGITLV